jgi:NhaA family Na+:H+ antiporter
MADRRALFSSLGPGALRNYADTLRGESAGGVLLGIAALLALIWANSPWADTYEMVRSIEIGPASLHLDLSLQQWAADGLLAIFFFVVGLELKREIVEGELRRFGTAIVPVAAALGGMAVPALFYLLVNSGPDGATEGWAIPTATDIAFAIAILGLVARGLPTAVRAFLLTLAVVDDLLAILIIAVGYSDGLALGWAAAAAAVVVVFAFLVRRGVTAWVLVPLAVTAWALLHASGIHATIAGVALGLVVPVASGAAERFEHRWRPVSAGVAVPLFALLVAGVTVDSGVLLEALRDPVSQGIALGLVLGKPVGIVLATWLVSRLRGVQLAPGVRWADVAGVGLLAGIGFTVSLLIAELAFRGSEAGEHATLAVLVSSLVAAALGGALLRSRGQARVAEGAEAEQDDTGGEPAGGRAH